jgi:serine/threonine-protein kinase
MPLAQLSLQDAIEKHGRFADTQAADVLLQIASGLAEIPDITHRDLKPANILSQEGVWRIADFGIARFVEESTSLQTLKDCLSPPYAAPEQWQLERATSATDIYAMGCIGYALVTGRPPFSGPSASDFKQQHLLSIAAPLDGTDPQLRALVSMMLRKAPEARPSLARVCAILRNMISAPASCVSDYEPLVNANVRVAEAQSAEERREHEAAAVAATRARLAQQGFSTLKDTAEELGRRILTAAPLARVGLIPNFSVSLGPAKLWIRQAKDFISPDAFRQSSWDVVLGATVGVEQDNPRYIWSASLWYAKLPHETDYRWVEVSYFRAFSGDPYAPFALTEVRDADLAAGKGMHSCQIAWGPEAIDDENLDEFCGRWAALLARAVDGMLSRPRNLPLRGRFWEAPR